MRRWILGAIVFAALWMGWALMLAVAANAGNVISRVFAALPRVPGVFYGWPLGWAIAAGVLTTLLVALAYATLGRVLTKATHPSFAAGWLAAVLTGVLVGIALDLPSTISSFGMFGIRGLLGEPFNLQLAIVWATLAGWIPALVVSRRRTAPETQQRVWSAPMLAAAAAATMLVTAALVGVGLGGTAAANAAARQAAIEHAEAEGSAFGAVPDPNAQGDPVAARAAKADPYLAQACTFDNASLLLGAADAATGHRAQVIELMNVSEAPCVVEGYPDIAFGDQNEHSLAVTVERGSSFMAQDAGPLRIEVPPLSSVTAVIGWDANSPHGALVAHSLHTAIRAGDERGSWPIQLDIVEGSTVSVTAWRDAGATAPEE